MTHLDDASAIHILKTIAQARLRSDATDLTLEVMPAFCIALAAEFGAAPAQSSEGDLARAALALLAGDPAFAGPIQLMAQEGASISGQRYIEPATIALTTAALLVLQTSVKFKVASSGKWSFEVDKKSAGDGAVKLLIERLLSYLPN